MVTTYEYVFSNVTENHTIEAEFEPTPEPPTPTGDEIVKMYVKISGIWVPLFTES